MAANAQPADTSFRRIPLGVHAADALLALARLNPERYPVLLDSAAHHPEQGQFDVLMAFPGARLDWFAARGGVTTGVELPISATFLDAFDVWWRQERIAPIPSQSDTPFIGGWFVYLSYELAVQVEPALKAVMCIAPDQLLAQAVRIPAALLRDRVSGQTWWVSETNSPAQLAQVQADLQQVRTAPMHSSPVMLTALHEDPPEDYVRMVRAAQEHIAAGDVYQANLSRGWHTDIPAEVAALDVYAQLRRANPAPFAGYARLDKHHAVISSSPERLLQVRDGWVSTRPIAGTRPRAIEPEADAELVRELKAHPKERAEHIMLIDLERNDLGRICVGGTVRVNEYMTIETYTHVHHIVSNVRGQLRDEVQPGQAIAAVFPGGTITGCPKVRCMQIIAEQEQTSRGAYTGSMGYVNRDGSMDLNILIRTLELNGRKLNFRAGAGIVADSIPERELDETRAKALGMLRALPMSKS